MKQLLLPGQELRTYCVGLGYDPAIYVRECAIRMPLFWWHQHDTFIKLKLEVLSYSHFTMNRWSAEYNAFNKYPVCTSTRILSLPAPLTTTTFDFIRSFMFYSTLLFWSKIRYFLSTIRFISLNKAFKNYWSQDLNDLILLHDVRMP